MKQIRTSQMRIGLIAAMLAMTVGVGSATGLVTSDSTTWEGSYECDALPVDAGWTSNSGGGENPMTTVIADPLNPGNNFIRTVAPDDGAYYRGYRWIKDPGAFDAQTNGGVTFEFRVKTVSKLMYVDARTSSATDSRRLIIDVSTDSVRIKDNDINTDVVDGIDEGEWTTLRVSCDDTSWKVYLNDDPSVYLEVAVTGSRGVRTEERFDVYALYPDMEFELDYFRWTNAGAFDNSPPPECGDEGYKNSDFNEDCYVNMTDFWYISNEWLECTDPSNSACDEFWM
jgi:hypothetical protein